MQKIRIYIIDRECIPFQLSSALIDVGQLLPLSSKATSLSRGRIPGTCRCMNLLGLSGLVSPLLSASAWRFDFLSASSKSSGAKGISFLGTIVEGRCVRSEVAGRDSDFTDCGRPWKEDDLRGRRGSSVGLRDRPTGARTISVSHHNWFDDKLLTVCHVAFLIAVLAQLLRPVVICNAPTNAAVETPVVVAPRQALAPSADTSSANASPPKRLKTALSTGDAAAHGRVEA